MQANSAVVWANKVAGLALEKTKSISKRQREMVEAAVAGGGAANGGGGVGMWWRRFGVDWKWSEVEVRQCGGARTNTARR